MGLLCLFMNPSAFIVVAFLCADNETESSTLFGKSLTSPQTWGTLQCRHIAVSSEPSGIVASSGQAQWRRQRAPSRWGWCSRARACTPPRRSRFFPRRRCSAPGSCLGNKSRRTLGIFLSPASWSGCLLTSCKALVLWTMSKSTLVLYVWHFYIFYLGSSGAVRSGQSSVCSWTTFCTPPSGSQTENVLRRTF